MRVAMESPPDDNNFVRQLWAEMPNANRDFQSYGEVLAQIAFDFIVHHELAHAGLGHEWVMATASVSEELQRLADEERTWSIDEVFNRLRCRRVGVVSGLGGKHWKPMLT